MIFPVFAHSAKKEVEREKANGKKSFYMYATNHINLDYPFSISDAENGDKRAHQLAIDMAWEHQGQGENI